MVSEINIKLDLFKIDYPGDMKMKTFFKRIFRRFPLENFEVFKNSNAD